MRLLAITLISFCLDSGTTRIPSPPNPRHLEEITYDKANNKLLVFGGIEMIKDGWIEPVMMYEWDGKTWNNKEAKGPAGRRGHAWIYDESNRETMLIGGVTTGDIIKDSVVFDVWAWDGKAWNLLNSLCPVKEPEGVYDPVNNRILVYGDSNNKQVLDYNVPAAFELWEYKNGKWNKLSADGPNIIGSRMIAFDIARNKLVVPVFEENNLIVWEWAGNEWIKMVFDKDCPVYRSKSALAYDPFEKVIILFGGLSADRKQLGDFWRWDGKEWKQIEIKEGPSARNSPHFACSNNELFLYGGSVPKPAPEEGLNVSNELWRWKNNVWTLLK